MNAICEICGVTVLGAYVARDDSTEQRQAEYDSLAAHMWAHLSDFHPAQMEEGILCQRRAAKLYAMNWATTGSDAQQIQQAWRSTLLLMMIKTTRREAQAEAAAAEAGGGVSSTATAADPPETAAALNVKNESRKVSI